MELAKISTRYAKAIYQYAKEKGEEDVLKSELQMLSEQFLYFPDMQKILENPTVENHKKLQVLMTASGGEEHISHTARRVLKMIVDQDRIEYTRLIALIYEKIYKEDKNIITASLRSVRKLDEHTKQSLVKLISQDGQKVEFKEEIDESLIGGFVLQIEDQRFDASISNQLQEIRKELLKK